MSDIFKLEWDPKQFEDLKKKLSKEATARVLEKTINETLVEIKKAEQEEMKKCFDKPTPWILNGLYVWRANRSNLEGYVGFKDAQAKILLPHVEGGGREFKRSEKWFQNVSGMSGTPYWVPGAWAPRNAYGNVPGGQITRMLSAAGAHPDPYSRSTKRSKRRNRAVKNLVVLGPRQGRMPGVYQRVGRGLKPMLIFVKGVTYQRRFMFYEVGQKTADRVFKQRFDANYEAMWRTGI